MKTLDELISVLQFARKINGDMKISICVNAHIFDDIEVNCTGDTLYIEGYEEVK